MDYNKEFLKALAYKGLNLACLYISAFLFTVAKVVGLINVGVSNE